MLLILGTDSLLLGPVKGEVGSWGQIAPSRASEGGGWLSETYPFLGPVKGEVGSRRQIASFSGQSRSAGLALGVLETV